MALYSGLWVRHDAISSSLGLKVDLLERLREAGFPVETTVFVHDTDRRDDPDVHRHDGITSLLADPAFAAADVHIFEYGIHYPLFDAVYFTRPEVASLGVFHNVTPPPLASTHEERVVLERSIRQRENLAQMDHVMCDSEFNRDDLLAMGLPPQRLSVVHLPSFLSSPDRTIHDDRPPDGDVELLYIGRLVTAKGILDLVEAARRLVAAGRRGFRVTLTGKREFSDPGVVAEVERAAADPELGAALRLVREPDDGELTRLYQEADAVVIPSYHEGFCVPVIEALAHDCFVITSDAGNLPYIVDDCGLRYPVGDAEALAAAIWGYVESERTIRRDASAPLPLNGAPSRDEWRRRVAEHVEDYTPEAFERGFIAALARAMSAADQTIPSWMTGFATHGDRRATAVR